MNTRSDASPPSAFAVSPSQSQDPFDVVVCGPARVDYLLKLSGEPRPGADLQIEREVRCAGGEGLLCAVTLARWGLRVCLLSNPIGDDGSGRMVLRALEAVPGLVSRAPVVPGLETPYVVRLCSWTTPPLVLRRAVVAEHSAAAAPTHLLAVCFGEMGEASRHLAREANTHNTPCLWMHQGRHEPELGQVALQASSYVFVPLVFLHKHVEQDANSGNVLSLILQRDRGDGVWCAPNETPRVFEASEAATSEPLDLLGEAGAEGVFMAGLAWARLQGWPWERALSLSANAVALKLRSGPGVDNLPSLAQVLALSAPQVA